MNQDDQNEIKAIQEWRSHRTCEAVTKMETRKAEVLVALQQSLLGEVSANLRVVAVEYDDTSIHFDAYYNGEITDEVRDAMLCVETEVMALFPETHAISHATIRWDYPQRVPNDRLWVYCRQERDA